MISMNKYAKSLIDRTKKCKCQWYDDKTSLTKEKLNLSKYFYSLNFWFVLTLNTRFGEIWECVHRRNGCWSVIP